MDESDVKRIIQEEETLTTIADALDKLSNRQTEITERQDAVLAQQAVEMQEVAAGIQQGLGQVADRLENVFKERRTPEDAVTRREMQQELQRIVDTIQPVINVAQNFKDAVGQAPCDNCAKPVTMDMDECSNCGGKVYWEL